MPRSIIAFSGSCGYCVHTHTHTLAHNNISPYNIYTLTHTTRTTSITALWHKTGYGGPLWALVICWQSIIGRGNIALFVGSVLYTFATYSHKHRPTWGHGELLFHAISMICSFLSPAGHYYYRLCVFYVHIYKQELLSRGRKFCSPQSGRLAAGRRGTPAPSFVCTTSSSSWRQAAFIACQMSAVRWGKFANRPVNRQPLWHCRHRVWPSFQRRNLNPDVPIMPCTRRSLFAFSSCNTNVVHTYAKSAWMHARPLQALLGSSGSTVVLSSGHAACLPAWDRIPMAQTTIIVHRLPFFSIAQLVVVLSDSKMKRGEGVEDVKKGFEAADEFPCAHAHLTDSTSVIDIHTYLNYMHNNHSPACNTSLQPANHQFYTCCHHCFLVTSPPTALLARLRANNGWSGRWQSGDHAMNISHVIKY